jgi:hypothetical protein
MRSMCFCSGYIHLLHRQFLFTTSRDHVRQCHGSWIYTLPRGSLREHGVIKGEKLFIIGRSPLTVGWSMTLASPATETNSGGADYVARC